jgi:hypothetical protein
MERTMAKKSKRARAKKANPKGGKRKKSQTRQPFEQDTKRRIGQYGQTGDPPIMQ